MRVSLVNHLDDLADDTRAIATTTPAKMVNLVRDGVRTGNQLARDDARVKSGRHGKHYSRAFTSEVKFIGFGVIVGEYGPDSSKRQGRMEFERGPGRQTSPHRSLARSHSMIAPAFRGEVRALGERVFW